MISVDFLGFFADSTCGRALPVTNAARDFTKNFVFFFLEDQGMGYETPYPEPPPRTPHGNYRMISCNNLSMKINKFAFKRSIISISKYPESFVKIEFVDLKKINNYCIVLV